MKILYTAFNGKDNSSKILLDKITVKSADKLYLRNSFDTSVKQLINKLKKYELIISFGQAPLDKDTIKIEVIGKKDKDLYKTDFNYLKIKKDIEKKGLRVYISNDAGDFLCNNLYYNGLKYIKENNINCKMLFIHIPKIENISNIELLAKVFLKENKRR